MKLSERIQGFIATNKTADAIQEYLNLFKEKDKDLYTESLLYSSRFKKLSQENRMGLIEYAQFNTQLNQINFALLSLLDQIEDVELKPKVNDTVDGSGYSIFISYAHEDSAYMERLSIHLEPLKKYEKVTSWIDTLIMPGDNWDASIKSAFATANIVLILVSADYLSSTYCNMEMQWAVDSNKIVVPIILEPCSWDVTALQALQALPTGAKPVSLWDNREEAFADITSKLRGLLTGRR